MKRENAGRSRTVLAVSALTACLLILLLFSWVTGESKRTVRQALAGIEGAPLTFSRESGFFEEGFLLKIVPDERIPRGEGIEIRYTWDGSEPTAQSPLYEEEGIDLSLIASEMLEFYEEKERQREAVIGEEAGAGKSREDADENEAADPGQDQASAEAGQDQAAADAGEEQDPAESARPTLEEGRAAWEREKWLSASDAGVRPERTKDGICVIPLRARIFQGEDASRVVTMTYVIGPGVRERFEGVYVVGVTTDPWNLFDYDNGFMVPGSHYESDVARGVRADRAGNAYQEGDDWTRDGHVTLFSSDGDVLLEEDAGLSISGYSSRGLPTRSFRARAMPEHGSSGDHFSLDIFSSSYKCLSENRHDGSFAGNIPQNAAPASSANGPDIHDFRKIKFRTHGVPNYHIRSVRNEYAKILSDEAGFPGMAECRLGVMFLNGEFYTVCDITPSADRDYLSRLFGLNLPDAVEKYDGSDMDVFSKSKILRYLTADLTDPACQRRLEAAVDMDNYISYYAMEVLFNNVDWPYNNVTVWRYLGEEDPSNPYTDGRIRFVLDDMDQILTNGLHGDPGRWSTEVVDYMMRDKHSTFHHVMECKKYRDAFLTRVDDLLATAFEPEHASAILSSLYGALRREYLLDYGEEFWAEMEDAERITRDNIFEKEALYRADVEKYMGLSERYSVRIEAGEGVTVSWNGMTVGGGSPVAAWENNYYRGTSFTITAEAAEGYRFLGFEVDGRRLDSETGQLEVSDALLRKGKGATLTVRALAGPAE